MNLEEVKEEFKKDFPEEASILQAKNHPNFNMAALVWRGYKKGLLTE